MDVRRRVNVSKTSTDKYSWEMTVEITGELPEWSQLWMRMDGGKQGLPETNVLAGLVMETADVATAEVRRQIEQAAKQGAGE